MSEDDEDWFERAVKEIGGGERPSEEPPDRETAETDTEEAAERDTEEAEGVDAEAAEKTDAERPTEPDAGTEPTTSGAEVAETEEDPASGDEFGGFAGSPEDGDESPEPAGEWSGITEPPDGLGSSEGVDPGGGDPAERSEGVAFDADSGEDFGFGDFGGPGSTDEPNGTDIVEPRDSGFGGSGAADVGGADTLDEGGDKFGFDDFGGGDGPAPSTDFDEESFESDIDRIQIGIEGLDDMILGGVPERSLITTIGSAGTGKTTFALHFLHQALRSGENAVYITLEESREAILSTAEDKGWPFREYEEEGLLAVVAIDPIEMANSLASIRNDLSRLISEFDAERLVLDSVSLLEMMYDHPAKRRSEVFDFTRSLKEAGVTTMLTSEASEDNPYASRHGVVEYLTDAVFILQYVRASDFRETRLAVEIQKIRDSNHSRETKPYEITDEGISVYQQANIF